MFGIDIDEQSYKSIFIMISLLITHILAYIAACFRKWEIQRYGQMDLNGVFRAPKEYVLQTVEIIIECIIIGFSINHLIQGGKEAFHQQSYINYWVIFDCVLTFQTLGYSYFTNKMMKNCETQKNIFTLYYVQEQQEKLKRDNLQNF